jgi:hypothetical protein
MAARVVHANNVFAIFDIGNTDGWVIPCLRTLPLTISLLLHLSSTLTYPAITSQLLPFAPTTLTLLYFRLSSKSSSTHPYTHQHHTNIRNKQPCFHWKSQVVGRDPIIESEEKEQKDYWKGKSVVCEFLAERSR